MAVSLTLAVLLLSAPATPGKESGLLLTTAAMERYPLPVSQLTVVVDEWAAEVRLTTSQPIGALAKALARSALCPRQALRDGALVLQCVTGRLEAELTRSGATSTLALRALRGLPWRNRLALRTRVRVEQHTLGGPCPGTTPDAQAECLLEAGAPEQARPPLEAAAATQLVSLRKGDLALLLDQDPVAALAHYEAAGSEGTLGRLAHLRRCELVGCQGLRDPYETVALPEPARTEVELRQLRALALGGDRARAAALLSARLADAERPSPCGEWVDLCLALTSAALRDADGAAQAGGLTLYVQLLPLLRARDARLARQAADVAAALGAYRFAANLLASVTDAVAPGELGPHLARTAALYDGAEDPVRAGVIREYSVARLRRTLRAPSALPPPGDEALTRRLRELVADSEHQLALAGASSATARARTLGR